jgi:hypothetical protein
MCSNRWAIPVMPGRSFALPTCATQPAAMVGSSCRSTSSTRMPLASVCSVTGTFWAMRGRPGGRKRDDQSTASKKAQAFHPLKTPLNPLRVNRGNRGARFCHL